MNRFSGLMLSLFFLAACDSVSMSGSAGKQAAASSSSTAATEVTLSGDNGQAVLGGDTLLIKEGKLLINNQFIHDIPAGAVVRYSIASDVKSIYINDELIPLNK
jgi:hypothetical protein